MRMDLVILQYCAELGLVILLMTILALWIASMFARPKDERAWNNPALVGTWTPILAVACLEWANLNQLYRMWTEWTAAGQSLWGWMSVWVALVLWLNFYRVVTPNERFAFWGTVLGIVMNSAVILSVVFFRYWIGV
jgi:hypothetical protein